MSTPIVSFRGVHKNYGDDQILHDISFDLMPGSITSLVGPSGCGKSTLFRMLLGIEDPTSGEILIQNNEGELQKVTGPSGLVGIVPQNYDLMPHLTSVKNIALAPKLAESSIFSRWFAPWSWLPKRREHISEAEKLLERFGIAHARDRYPKALSGGMKQRVAIAQVMINKPKIILMDEPFSALDEATRAKSNRMLLEMGEENRRAIEEGLPPPYTVIIVTHELNEAIYVSERMLALSQFRYWEGKYKECPGATIVLDQECPVYDPHDIKDHTEWQEIKDKAIDIAFDEETRQTEQALREVEARMHTDH